MARATSSLPVPVSPWMRTVLSVGATCAISPRSRCTAGESPTMSWRISSTSTVAPSAAKVPFELLKEEVLVDRLGEEIVAAARARALLVAAHRARREHDHRNAGERRVGLEAPRRLPAIHARQRQVHQDEIGLVLHRAPERRLAVLGHH